MTILEEKNNENNEIKAKVFVCWMFQWRTAAHLIANWRSEDVCILHELMALLFLYLSILLLLLYVCLCLCVCVCAGLLQITSLDCCRSPNDHAHRTLSSSSLVELLLLAFNIKWKTVFIYNCHSSHTKQHHSRSQNTECRTQKYELRTFTVVLCSLFAEWVLTEWDSIFWCFESNFIKHFTLNGRGALNIRLWYNQSKLWYTYNVHRSVICVVVPANCMYLAIHDEIRNRAKSLKFIHYSDSYSLEFEWMVFQLIFYLQITSCSTVPHTDNNEP